MARKAISVGAVKVAFDSRPVSDLDGVGRYSRCLLAALADTAAASDQLVETHRPSVLARSRSADVFHSPWMDGAMLHSPCPTVVTIHDLAALKRRSEHLRCGGLHLRLRRLALQRATHVIVPSEAVAQDAVVALGLERSRVIVIPIDSDWHTIARTTWSVYRQAAVPATRDRVAGTRLGAARGPLLRPPQ
jgi:hypothetical protein